MSPRGLAVLAVLALACRDQRSWPTPRTEDAAVSAPPPVVRPTQKPPLPLAPPPADAERLTGLVEAPAATVLVKRLKAGAGARPGRNDTVGLLMTGWRPNGEVFLTTAERKRAVQKSLATMAPGFVAAVQTMQVGEQAMLWIPVELSYPGPPPAAAEPTVFLVELTSIDPAPPVPSDVAAPPPSALTTPSGVRSVVVRPGAGTTRPRPFDHVVFHYTAWDASGRMIDSSEARKRPSDSVGFRHGRGLEEILGLMVAGERRRAWVPAPLVELAPPAEPQSLCYEVELISVEPLPAPPAAPPATPPATAATTADGVRWIAVGPASGPRPAADAQVSLRFTAWRADGRLVDSSIPFGRTLDAPLAKLYASWIPVVAELTVGQRALLWVPAAVTAAATPSRPPGELRFELELVAIGPPRTNPAPPVPLVPGGAP